MLPQGNLLVQDIKLALVVTQIVNTPTENGLGIWKLNVDF